IARAPKWAQPLLRELRRVIRKAAPEARESISYRMPYYSQNGRLAYFAAFTSHCSFLLAERAGQEDVREGARLADRGREHAAHSAGRQGPGRADSEDREKPGQGEHGEEGPPILNARARPDMQPTSVAVRSGPSERQTAATVWRA